MFNQPTKAVGQKAFPDDAPDASAVKLTLARQWHDA